MSALFHTQMKSLSRKTLQEFWNHVADSLLHEGERYERRIIVEEDSKQPVVQIFSFLFGVPSCLRLWDSLVCLLLCHLNRVSMVGDDSNFHRFNDLLENLVQIYQIENKFF